MKSRIFVSLLTAASTVSLLAAPANAGGAPVACYQPVSEPAAYATVEESYVVRPAETVYDVVPARYGWGTRQVEVEPGRVVETPVAAEYRWVERQVVLEPARVVRHAAPATYQTVSEPVLLEPGGARFEWRVVNGKRVYCRVAVEPRYGSSARTIVVPGREWTEVIPAQYGVSRERVLVRPATVERYVVAPRYETVREWMVIEPERRVARVIPAQYGTRQVTVKVREERSGWRQVHLRGSC
ncbi:hypothetical protein [Jiella sonneratiae]|uniref:Uncharacterized protein n=1 Tax=Jiella sonneratiae TaxID=2816856 RepID=A0ABS3IZA2_9HYPH|nr:hypothetical protein [Jiella sonneratiae]MBO0902735.1 hypothetical protein [Jiella sonneratiae]